MPGEFHGQSSPEGYSPLSSKESDTAEQLIHSPLHYVWEDARIWAHWNRSFDSHLIGPSHFSGCCTPLSVLACGCCGWWLDGCTVLCLSIGQVTVFVHTVSYKQTNDMTSFNLHHLWKDLVPTQSHSEILGIRISIHGLGRTWFSQ